MRNFYPELEYYKLAQDAYKAKTDARITELEKKLDAILEYLGAECKYKPAGYNVEDAEQEGE